MAANEPMIAGVAGRYATALFDLAKENEQLDSVARNLDGFLALLDTHNELDEVLMSPLHGLDEKQAILQSVMNKAGITGIAGNFLALVAKNNRLSFVKDMARAFERLVQTYRGETSAQVISAHALSDDHKQALRQTLKTTLGQDVKIDASVDPDLLGGLVVKLGSKMIDNSLRTKLNNLRVTLKDAS